jgi:hypothetical protein
MLKAKRIRDKKHLRWLHELPCLCCGKRDDTVVGHHLRIGTSRGMGLKAPDNYTVPLCFVCHDAMHRYGDHYWLEAHDVRNGPDIANRLYELTSKTTEATDYLRGVRQ